RPATSPLWPYTTRFRSVSHRRCASFGRDAREACCLDAALCADAEGVELAPANVARDQVPQHRVEKLLPGVDEDVPGRAQRQRPRSEEHTSELQSRENLV